MPVGESAITAVYCLLEKKTEQTYENMLKAISESCHDRKLFPDPKKVSVDFESAVISAITNVLGAETSGCFYHLCQSTWRKIQELGLVPLYSEDEQFRTFCGMIDGLALLPLDKVLTGMEHLKTICPESGHSLLEYFDITYVSGKYKATQPGPMTIRMRRNAPRFPPKVWNMHSATVEGDPRTNNFCEGWNSRFQHLVGHKHPTIWRLIRALQLDCASSSVAIAQADLGNPPSRRVKKTSISLQSRLRNLCGDLDRNEKSVADFLGAVAQLIRLQN